MNNEKQFALFSSIISFCMGALLVLSDARGLVAGIFLILFSIALLKISITK